MSDDNPTKVTLADGTTIEWSDGKIVADGLSTAYYNVGRETIAGRIFAHFVPVPERPIKVGDIVHVSDGSDTAWDARMEVLFITDRGSEGPVAVVLDATDDVFATATANLAHGERPS